MQNSTKSSLVQTLGFEGHLPHVREILEGENVDWTFDLGGAEECARSLVEEEPA